MNDRMLFQKALKLNNPSPTYDDSEAIIFIKVILHCRQYVISYC